MIASGTRLRSVSVDWAVVCPLVILSPAPLSETANGEQEFVMSSLRCVRSDCDSDNPLINQMPFKGTGGSEAESFRKLLLPEILSAVSSTSLSKELNCLQVCNLQAGTDRNWWVRNIVARGTPSAATFLTANTYTERPRNLVYEPGSWWFTGHTACDYRAQSNKKTLFLNY